MVAVHAAGRRSALLRSHRLVVVQRRWSRAVCTQCNVDKWTNGLCPHLCLWCVEVDYILVY